jgi:hypothetical protein
VELDGDEPRVAEEGEDRRRRSRPCADAGSNPARTRASIACAFTSCASATSLRSSRRNGISRSSYHSSTGDPPPGTSGAVGLSRMVDSAACHVPPRRPERLVRGEAAGGAEVPGVERRALQSLAHAEDGGVDTRQHRDPCLRASLRRGEVELREILPDDVHVSAAAEVERLVGVLRATGHRVELRPETRHLLRLHTRLEDDHELRRRPVLEEPRLVLRRGEVRPDLPQERRQPRHAPPERERVRVRRVVRHVLDEERHRVTRLQNPTRPVQVPDHLGI